MKRSVLILSLLMSTFFGSIAAYAGVPNVVTTSPVDGSNNAAVTSPILVRFSEPVTWASIGNDTLGNYSIQVYEKATGLAFKAYQIVPQEDGTDFALTLNSELKRATTYLVRVVASVRSVATDNAMAANFEFAFDTTNAVDKTPPTVSSFLPPAGSISNPLNSIVSVYFSEAIDQTSLSSSTVFLTDKNNNTVSTTIAYDATMNALTLTPVSLLSLDGTYTLHVTTGVRDLSGNYMASDLVTTPGFNTIISDIIRPTVVSTTPLNGATSVVTDTIKIVFSEPMDPTTITTSTIGVVGPLPGTTAVAGVVTYNQTTSTAFFTASGGFALASDFRVAVTTGVRDLAGNYMLTQKTFTFTTGGAAVIPPMSTYCQVPPFVAGAGVKPNVLMILDNSLSMKDSAEAGDYSPTGKYYGLFDSTKMYSYAASGANSGWSPTTDTLNNTTIMSGASMLTSGNFLNWLLTSRLDALKMVMVGAVSDNGNNREHYSDQSTSPTKSYGGVTYTLSKASNVLKFKIGNANTLYDTNVRITNAERDANPGLIRLFKDKMNMGIEFFGSAGNNTDNGGRIAINVGQTGADFTSAVLTMTASTYTPLAESLAESVAYFKGGSSLYSNANYAAGGADPIKNACAKNFVVVVTDGEPTSDENLPGSKWPPNSGAVTAAAAGYTVKDYMEGLNALTGKGIKQIESWSPGRWDVNLQYNGNQNMHGTWYMPAVAYYAHTTDLRSDFANKQNLEIYTVFAFDDSPNAKELLKLTAKYGGFDLGGTDAPDAQVKYDKNLVGKPDNYYEASNGGEMVKQLTKAFNDILSKVSSGTAASILNNSEGSGANLLQAVFYPKKAFANAEITWLGEVQNLWYYIDPFLQNSSVRVDTVTDNKLNVKQDYLAQFYFDQTQQKTLVNLFPDTNGDGIADSTTPLGPYAPDDYANVKSLWRAGKLLWDRDVTTNPRTIYTRTGGLADTSGNSFDNTTTGLAKFSNVIESGYASRLTDELNFQNMLQVANVTEANKLVKYIHGVPELDANGNMIDLPGGYRSRLVKIGSTLGLWRLGDVVSSTPKLLANIPLNSYASATPTGYNDSTYEKFTKSQNYQDRGMVFVGSNDGMLHAFKLGKLVEMHVGSDKARLEGSDLGKEEWAFIPRNALPYLRYTKEPDYSHLFLVDGGTVLFDASINAPIDNDMVKYPGCDAAHYWKCLKKTVTDVSTKALELNKSSWRTILIGSTGLGGAGRNNVGSGYCYAATNGTNCVKTPVDGVGYSSYFALDVTDPVNPKFMWEFNGDPTAGASADKKGGNLGYATTGPVIVREGEKDKNGRWFAVFASGPTGPIDSTQFLGRSDQPLTLFVVDIATGNLVRTIDTGIANAFAGSLSNGAIDTDKSKSSSAGFYKDDALYVGYTQQTGTTNTWYNGGVLRVLTKESEYPNASEDSDASALNKPWTVSPLINGIGPVTSAVTKLQDRGNGKLWLYFGTGRYYYKTSAGIDDPSSIRNLYGVQDPCYNYNVIDQSCTASALTVSNLTNKTTVTTAAATSDVGWYINLDPQISGTKDSERVITDPVASPNGVVFFTTFQPTSDVCSYGGSSFIWALNYSTGGTPSPRAMKGKLLMQVSTGAFAEISMVDAFGAKDGRRLTDPIQGVPPKAQGLSVLTNPKPIKKIMHIQER